jgi:hypothetical protein
MSDGFLDFSIGEGDDDVGKRAKRFTAEGGRTYRATFCWYSVPEVGQDGKIKAWHDDQAWNDDGTLTDKAVVRFTGCERVYKEGVGYVLYKSPAYAQFGEPRQTVATILLVWPTDKDGDLDASSFAAGKGYAVQPWIFSPDKYTNIKKSHKRFSLLDHDMAMSCPADGAKYQKLTFTPENENLLKKLMSSDKPQFREIVSKIRKDIFAVAESIHREMARDLTIDQIREAMGEEVDSPTGATNHAAKDVEDLLNDVL